MYLGYVKAVIYRFLSVVADIGWVWNFISRCFLKWKYIKPWKLMFLELRYGIIHKAASFALYMLLSGYLIIVISSAVDYLQVFRGAHWRRHVKWSTCSVIGTNIVRNQRSIINRAVSFSLICVYCSRCLLPFVLSGIDNSLKYTAQKSAQDREGEKWV